MYTINCGESEQDRYNNSNNTSTRLAPALFALIVYLYIILHLTYRYSSLAYSYTAADVFCHRHTGLHYEEHAQKALSEPAKSRTLLFLLKMPPHFCNLTIISICGVEYITEEYATSIWGQ